MLKEFSPAKEYEVRSSCLGNSLKVLVASKQSELTLVLAMGLVLCPVSEPQLQNKKKLISE